MKKKLMLATALLALGATTNVKAEEQTATENQEIKFQLDGEQQEIKDEKGNKISVDTFYSGTDNITVHMPQGWGVRLYRQKNPESSKDRGTLVEMPYLCENVIIDKVKDAHTGQENPITESRYKDGYKKNDEGWNYKIPLLENLTEEEKKEKKLRDQVLLDKNMCPTSEVRKKEPLNKDERLTFEFTVDGNFYAGSLIYVSQEKTKNNLVNGQENSDTPSISNLAESNGSSERPNEEKQEVSNLNEPQTWTQRAKERINKAWKGFKYYINPKNLFSRWRS